MNTYTPAAARAQWEGILAEYGPGHPRVQEARALVLPAAVADSDLHQALVASFLAYQPPARAQDAHALAMLLGLDPATADMFTAELTAPSWPSESVTWHGVVITAEPECAICAPGQCTGPGCAGRLPTGYALAPALAGPLCEAHDHLDYCEHGSCNDVAAEAPWAELCDRHGPVHVIDAGNSPGYAGGGCYWTTLECGCTTMDESNDVAAAR